MKWLSNLLWDLNRFVERMQLKVLIWRLGKPVMPEIKPLHPDEIDMGNMGRWQGTDDYRVPPASTRIDVSTYIKDDSIYRRSIKR